MNFSPSAIQVNGVLKYADATFYQVITCGMKLKSIGKGEGGRSVHPHFFGQEWIFNKLFTMWKQHVVFKIISKYSH